MTLSFSPEIVISTRQTVRRRRSNAVGLMLACALFGTLFGARNILLWVEDWPPSPLTDHSLGLANKWMEATNRICLGDLHAHLRHAERRLEAWGTDNEPPPPPETTCARP